MTNSIVHKMVNSSVNSTVNREDQASGYRLETRL